MLAPVIAELVDIIFIQASAFYFAQIDYHSGEVDMAVFDGSVVDANVWRRDYGRLSWRLSYGFGLRFFVRRKVVIIVTSTLGRRCVRINLKFLEQWRAFRLNDSLVIQILEIFGEFACVGTIQQLQVPVASVYVATCIVVGSLDEQMSAMIIARKGRARSWIGYFTPCWFKHK